MPGDMLSNIDELNFVPSSIHALQQLYLPDHVIYGGDWNADCSRFHSQHTIALSQFCVEEHLIHVIHCSLLYLCTIRQLCKKIMCNQRHRKPIGSFTSLYVNYSTSM